MSVQKFTALEAIIEMNSKGKPIATSEWFNGNLLLRCNGGFRSMPKDIEKAGALITGTRFMIEKENMPFGKKIEVKFTYNGKEKLAHIWTPNQFDGLTNYLITCGPERWGQTDYIKLLDMFTLKPITTFEELDHYTDIYIKFLGKINGILVENRRGGFLELANNLDKTHIYADRDAAAGLLERETGDFGHYGVGAKQNLGSRKSVKFIDDTKENIKEHLKEISLLLEYAYDVPHETVKKEKHLIERINKVCKL